MAKMISRLFPDAKAARSVEKQLNWAGFPRYLVRVIHGGDGVDAASVEDKLLKFDVPADVAAHFAKEVAKGGSAIAVRATYKPLNAARIAREIFAGSKAVDTGLENEEVRVADKPEPASSVLKSHPRILTRAPDPYGEPARPVTEVMGWKMLTSHRTKRSAISGGKFMLTSMIKSKPRRSKVMSGGRFMSRAFWPQKLLSTKSRRNSVIRGGDTPFSRVLALPLLSGRYDS